MGIYLPPVIVIIVYLILDVGKVVYIRQMNNSQYSHDDVIKWKHFPRYWPFVRGIHRSPKKASDAELLCFLLSAPE